MDRVVVASHIRYAEALQSALDSLAAQGFPASRTVVVLNGCDADEVTRDGDLTLVKSTSNIYEYSSFFAPRALGASVDDAFFLMHDTSRACAGFAESVQRAFDRFRRDALDILWCSSSGQCNLCVFGLNASEAASRMWDFKELDKARGVSMEHFSHDPLSIKGVRTLRQAYAAPPSEHRGTVAPYASGHARTAVYFPYVCVLKYYIDLNTTATHPEVP